jgi:hypothetical protein
MMCVCVCVCVYIVYSYPTDSVITTLYIYVVIPWLYKVID